VELDTTLAFSASQRQPDPQKITWSQLEADFLDNALRYDLVLSRNMLKMSYLLPHLLFYWIP